MDEVLLCIPCYHAPYEHPDALDFIEAVIKVYAPTRYIHLGDEADWSKINMHDRNPNSPFTAEEELDEAITHLGRLWELIPEMDIMVSNHGSLVVRNQKKSGLPSRVFRSYNEIFGAPRGWTWKDELVLKSGGREILFAHGLKTNAMAASKDRAMCVVQAHFHQLFEVKYWMGANNQLYWGVTSGSLINKKAMAFDYARYLPNNPLGLTLIVNGIPLLIPMVLNKKGRWTKSVA